MRNALAIGALVALIGAAPIAARGSTVRYALLVGNNQGLADDAPLRFAQADAERLSRALVQLGGFPEENTTVLRDRAAPTVLVANEVGLGIVPDNALARTFRDAAGRLNQHLAARADAVLFMVAGLPLRAK